MTDAENCPKCGANWEAVLDWQEGVRAHEAENKRLIAEAEQAKLARNASEACAEAAETKLAKALDLAEKIELQRQTAESREKALREKIDQLEAEASRLAGDGSERRAHNRESYLMGRRDCLRELRAAFAAWEEAGSECVNGCHKPVCPPSRVLCADCFAELDGKMQALAAGKKN